MRVFLGCTQKKQTARKRSAFLNLVEKPQKASKFETQRANSFRCANARIR